MRIGSLFSGIGGLELGLECVLGGEVVWQVEIDEHCRRVLAKHWPNAERHEDIKEMTWPYLHPKSVADVDLVCGGFPCTDVSAAGKKAGLKEGTRSGLWFEFQRLLMSGFPKWVVVENVMSGKKLWLP
jgi:DNA (cytosine-5)-methyltransferase 1